MLLQSVTCQPRSSDRLLHAFNELCIGLQVHVLQCLASVQPVVSQGYCHLENLHLFPRAI